MELSEFCLFCLPSAFQDSSQCRVCQHSASNHHAIQLRKPLSEPLQIFRVTDIPIIAEWISALFCRHGKYIQIRCIFIEILLQPWMYDQLFQRIPVIDLQEIFKFFRFTHSDPCLHRNLPFTLLEDFIQKTIQPIRLFKEPCSTPFRNNRPGRTAKVQIHFFISILCKLFSCLYKILCLVRQNLRHCQNTTVIFRQHIFLFPRAEMPFLVRTDKRNKILVKSVKALF